MWQQSGFEPYMLTESHTWPSWPGTLCTAAPQAQTQNRDSSQIQPGGRALPVAMRTLQRTMGNQRVGRILDAIQQGQPAGNHQPAATARQDDDRLSSSPALVNTGSQPTHAGSAAALPTDLQRRSPGKPLPGAVRAELEERLQADLGQVRIHTDSQARQTATHLGADALAVESDIFFGPGQYDPTSLRGRRLLAHELAHVLQQGRRRRAPQTFALGQPDDRYEHEAAWIAGQLVQPGAPNGAAGWGQPTSKGRRQPLKIRERWRGPGALISRQAAPSQANAKSESVDALLLAAGITRAQALAIRYWYHQAQAVPRSAAWRHCYLACQIASRCGLPPLQMLDLKVLKKALDAFIGKADWEQILTIARGRACQCDAAASSREGQTTGQGQPIGAKK